MGADESCFHVWHPLDFWVRQTTSVNQYSYTSFKIADKHVKCAKKAGSGEGAGVWVRALSQHQLFSVLPQTPEL